MVIRVLKKEETMKQTYINPSLQVVKIKAQQLLAGSDLNVHNSSATEWGARENSFDDEE